MSALSHHPHAQGRRSPRAPALPRRQRQKIQMQASKLKVGSSSLVIALLCLAFLGQKLHIDGREKVGRRHPEDVAAAVRFSALHCVAGATEFDVAASGLVQGVTYRLVVEVEREGHVIYSNETSIAWSLMEPTEASTTAAAHVVKHMLPPLPAGPHRLRAWLFDAAADTEREALLAFRMGGATCAERKGGQEDSEHSGLKIQFPPFSDEHGGGLISQFAGEMELSFHILGAIAGIQYRVLVQELDDNENRRRPLQQEEVLFSIADDDSSDQMSVANEVHVNLMMFDGKQDYYDFNVAIFNVSTGLASAETKLYELSFTEILFHVHPFLERSKRHRVKPAVKGGSVIHLSELDGKEAGDGCPRASADLLCSLLSPLRAERWDGEFQDDEGEETVWENREGSGTGGENIHQLSALASDFPAFLLASPTDSASDFPPPKPSGKGYEYGLGWEAAFNVTVVLNPWHRPELLQKQLEALHQQTFPIAQIWVVLSDSPKEAELNDILAVSCQKGNTKCFEINSNYNFVYYMPWQVALQASTRYVWFLDDDVLPGRHALAFLLHVSNTQQYRDTLLGGRGTCVWPGMLLHPHSLIPNGSAAAASTHDYCDAPFMFMMREAENLDGSRFMLQQHVKLLFREEPGNGLPDWRDDNGVQQGKWLSNDYQLTHMLRKYAGRKSFILPCRSQHRGVVSDLCIDRHPDIGWTGSTTTGSRVSVRRDYINNMFSRGAEQVWTKRLRRREKPRAMVFAHTRTHAYTMTRVRELLQRRGVEHVDVTITGSSNIYMGSSFASTSPRNGLSEEEARKIFGFTEDDLLQQRIGMFSLKIGFDYPRAHLPEAAHAEAVMHFKEVLRSTRPLLVFLPLDRQGEGTQQQKELEHAVLSGAQWAAEYAGISVVWISQDKSVDAYLSTVIMKYSIREIRSTDAVAFCFFYNTALGAQSKEMFQPLGEHVDDDHCRHIASAGFDRMDLVVTWSTQREEQSGIGVKKPEAIVGWAFWTESLERKPSIGIALADAHQGRGLGKDLLKALIRMAEKAQLEELRLNVFVENERAINLYHSLGFEIMDTLIFDQRLEHVMRLVLATSNVTWTRQVDPDPTQM